MKKAFIGEFMGTFILVFFGCGAVAVEVIFGALGSLLPIATLWGIGVALAIAITGPLSGAHLNPAITLAFAFLTDFSFKRIPLYFSAQLLGSFLAAATLFVLFEAPLTEMEQEQGIQRAAEGGERTAKIFGEFHNPEFGLATPFAAEFLGTSLLAFIIFSLIDKRQRTRRPDWVIPIAIGAGLALIISIFAPLSMAGFNPARDFAPRLFSSFAGWKALPFHINGSSWFLVYILAPFLGAPLGAWLAVKLQSLGDES